MSEGKKDLTSIKVTREVADRLKEFGHKGESYSEVLTRLLDKVQHKKAS